MDEISYLRWIRRQVPLLDPVEVGIGDDTAVLRAGGDEPWLVTTDAVLDGVDFHLDEVGPRLAGRKGMGVGLSDIAAMAGRPTVAVVAVSAPREMDGESLKKIFEGIREVADEFQVAIGGGDFSVWDGALSITITCLGRGEPVLRSGARVGDAICVTGELGGSLLGKHLRFTPRIREALALREGREIHAMIDISDGLGRDLHHVLEESRVGAILHADAIPVSEDARRLARQTGRDPLDHALGDGEDFELLFTLGPDEANRLCQSPPEGIAISRIGVILEKGCFLERHGELQDLPPLGYVHGGD